jgi:hypothetical protein
VYSNSVVLAAASASAQTALVAVLLLCFSAAERKPEARPLKKIE